MKALTVVALALLSVGILINFIPALAYYYGTVSHEKYYGSFSNGLSLVYAVMYSPLFNSSYNYGFIINITKLNASYYLVQSKLYLLSGCSISFNSGFMHVSRTTIPSIKTYLLVNGSKDPSSFPFSASYIKEVTNYSKVLNINNSTFLQILFPKSDMVETSLLNFNISSSIATIGIDKLLGCPGYHGAHIKIFNTVVDSVPIGYYMQYGSQYVMDALSCDGGTNTSTELFMSMFPNLNESHKGQQGNLVMALVYSNGVPNQDLLNWFRYGLHIFSPVNIISIFIGMVLAVINKKRYKIA